MKKEFTLTLKLSAPDGSDRLMLHHAIQMLIDVRLAYAYSMDMGTDEGLVDLVHAIEFGDLEFVNDDGSVSKFVFSKNDEFEGVLTRSCPKIGPLALSRDGRVVSAQAGN